MKVTYTTANGRLAFEFESDNEKKLFTELAHIQEVFEETSCGCCGSDKILFDVREFDDNHYYKLVCTACNGTLDYGQHKTGDTLFAKRYDKEAGKDLPNRGWYHYQAQPQSESPKPAPTSDAQKAALQRLTNGSTPHILPPTDETPTQRHQKAMTGMNSAQTRDNLDAWLTYRNRLAGTSVQENAEAKQVYAQNLERLTRATSKNSVKQSA